VREAGRRSRNLLGRFWRDALELGQENVRKGSARIQADDHHRDNWSKRLERLKNGSTVGNQPKRLRAAKGKSGRIRWGGIKKKIPEERPPSSLRDKGDRRNRGKRLNVMDSLVENEYLCHRSGMVGA